MQRRRDRSATASVRGIFAGGGPGRVPPMRVAFLAASLIPALAAADAPAPPMKDVVVHGARHAAPGTKKFTSVSHLVYLNNCMPNGCTVNPGFDDSLTNHSSIPSQTAQLA